MKKIDLTGKRFGRWLVVGAAESKGTKTFWKCICDCGNERSVNTHSLKSGNSVSCGCVNKEGTIARCLSHGHANGGNGTRTYNCWRNMKSRCQNPKTPKYAVYGARGIVVCPQWQSFAGFLADMGECPSAGHSIDRIDNDGNYEPGNCRWATVEQQMSNQSTNTNLTFNGKTMTVSQWARELGMRHTTILQRIYRSGWNVERALTEPVHFGRH